MIYILSYIRDVSILILILNSQNNKFETVFGMPAAPPHPLDAISGYFAVPLGVGLFPFRLLHGPLECTWPAATASSPAWRDWGMISRQSCLLYSWFISLLQNEVCGSPLMSRQHWISAMWLSILHELRTATICTPVLQTRKTYYFWI